LIGKCAKAAQKERRYFQKNYLKEKITRSSLKVTGCSKNTERKKEREPKC